MFKPPNTGETAFTCPHCAVYSAQLWAGLMGRVPEQRAGMQVHKVLSMPNFSVSRCDHCGKDAIWFGEVLVFPTVAVGEPPHADMPAECAADFEEARRVFSASPRAAAALLRLVVQKLMPHLGEKGRTLDDDIASMVAKGLPLSVQQALDVCRVVGNNAVHPGEIDLQDTPDIALRLFGLINFVVQDRITRPKDIQALVSSLPPQSRAQVEKRGKRK